MRNDEFCEALMLRRMAIAFSREGARQLLARGEAVLPEPPLPETS